jgi:hypothetical protein
VISRNLARQKAMNKVKDSEWTRNGKGDKPRTDTQSKKYQENFDSIDWSAHKKSKQNEK